MLTGISVLTAIAELRPGKGGVMHSKMIAALRARGVRCADRFVVFRKPADLPELCVVRIKYAGEKRWGHVVLKSGRSWHDPLLPHPFDGDLPADRAWGDGARATSYLRIDR